MRETAKVLFQWVIILGVAYLVYNYIQADVSVRIVLSVFAAFVVIRLINGGVAVHRLEAELFIHRELIDDLDHKMSVHENTISNLQDEIASLRERVGEAEEEETT
nr:hypothetical protein [uncultured Noviherbaspirillum sp.]